MRFLFVFFLAVVAIMPFLWPECERPATAFPGAGSRNPARRREIPRARIREGAPGATAGAILVPGKDLKSGTFPPQREEGEGSQAWSPRRRPVTGKKLFLRRLRARRGAVRGPAPLENRGAWAGTRAEHAAAAQLRPPGQGLSNAAQNGARRAFLALRWRNRVLRTCGSKSLIPSG